MPPERDTVPSHRGGRAGPQVPLVQLRDPTYEAHPHLILTDDEERHAIERLVVRETGEEWRQGLLTAQDGKLAHIWAAVVATTALGGLLLSAADLVLHLLK